MIDIDGDGKLTKQEFLRVSGRVSDYNNCHEGAVICSEVFICSSLQGCLQDETLLSKLAKIIDTCQPPTAYQSSYY